MIKEEERINEATRSELDNSSNNLLFLGASADGVLMGPASLPVCPRVCGDPLLVPRGAGAEPPQVLVGSLGLNRGGAHAGAPQDCGGKGPPVLLRQAPP